MPGRAAGRCPPARGRGQRGDDRRRAVHVRCGRGRGRGLAGGREALRRRVGGGREALRGRGPRRCEALCGRIAGRWGGEGGRGGGLAGRGERGRGEAGGAGLRLLLRGGGRLLLQHLAAEVLQQRLQAAVEALSDRGEPPGVLEVDVAEHDGPLGGELRAGEGVPGDLLAARDDAQVAGTDLRHLPGAVDGRREGQLADAVRNPVERDPERLRVARLGTEQLEGLLRRLRLVEEDEVPVVREPFLGVQAEAADVEGQSGAGDLHAYVQIGARREVTDPGLVAALEFPGHAIRPSPIPRYECVAPG